METGTVLKWEMDGAKSKGFGFLETRTGERVLRRKRGRLRRGRGLARR